MCAICSRLNSLIFTCYLSIELLDDLLNNLRWTIKFFVLIFYLGFPKLINVSLDSCDVLITCNFSIMLKTLSFIMSSPLHLAQLAHIRNMTCRHLTQHTCFAAVMKIYLQTVIGYIHQSCSKWLEKTCFKCYIPLNCYLTQFYNMIVMNSFKINLVLCTCIL